LPSSFCSRELPSAITHGRSDRTSPAITTSSNPSASGRRWSHAAGRGFSNPARLGYVAQDRTGKLREEALDEIKPGKALRSIAFDRTESLATSNRVSEFAIWILEFREQRLARKMRHQCLNCRKFGVQRLSFIRLSRGNAVVIFSVWTWPAETALAGWGGRTRTRKCRFNPAGSA
jgi:hypothetical protein